MNASIRRTPARKPRSKKLSGIAAATVPAAVPAAVLPSVNAALWELAMGQSNVKLELDSKAQVKPSVHVFHHDPAEARRLAEEHFDKLIDKYYPKTTTTAEGGPARA